MSWVYIDTSGNKQGPFTETIIKKWISKGFFPGTIRIKSVESNDDFVEISKSKIFGHLFTKTTDIKEENEIFSGDKTKTTDKKEENEIFKGDKSTHSNSPRTEIITKTNQTENTIKPLKIIGDGNNIGPPPNSKELHWLYLDNEKKIRGPFPNSLMLFWLQEKHFDTDLKVLSYEYPIENSVKLNPKNLILTNYNSIKDIPHCDILKTWSNKEKLNWFYLNEEGNEEGPFKPKTMMKWLQRGYLPLTLKIRSDIQIEFVLISEIDKPFGEKFPEIPCWSIFDKNNLEYGQFTTSTMSLWFYQDFFDKNTFCKNVLSGTNKPITIGEAQIHFTKKQEISNNNYSPLYDTKRQSLQILSDQNNTPLKSDENIQKCQWFYIDLDNGVPQGPFTSEAMRQWRKEGYLPDYIKIKPVFTKEEVSDKNNLEGYLTIKERILNGDLNFNGTFSSQFGRNSAHNNFMQISNAINPLNPFQSSRQFVIDEPKWFYVDDNQKERGPFTSQQMRHWWFTRQINPRLIVRKETEPLHLRRSIGSRQCCFTFSDRNVPNNPVMIGQNRPYTSVNILNSNRNEQSNYKTKERRLNDMFVSSEDQKRVAENISKLSKVLNKTDKIIK